MIKKEVKTYLWGRRGMLFFRLLKKKEASTASFLREIIDYYLENHPDIK